MSNKSVSIVLVATESEEAIRRFIEAAASVDAERIVVAPRGLADSLRDPRIDVRIEADPRASVPRMRELGLDAASGDVVIFTEDCVVPEPGWPVGLIGPAAAGGAVLPRPDAGPWDRAVHVFEYGCFAPGARPTRLPGNNFSLDRSLAESLGPEIHEHEVPPPFEHVTTAAVRHVRSYRAEEAIRDRLRFGFDFGSRRRGIPRILGIPLIPVVFLIQFRRMLTIGGFDPIPMSILVAAWSLGEGLGITFGRRSERSDRRLARGKSERTDYRLAPPPFSVGT